MKTIHYGSPNIKIEDFDFLKKLVKSNFITQGKFVTEFENKLSKYLKCKYFIKIKNIFFLEQWELLVIHEKDLKN